MTTLATIAALIATFTIWQYYSQAPKQAHIRFYEQLKYNPNFIPKSYLRVHKTKWNPCYGEYHLISYDIENPEGEIIALGSVYNDGSITPGNIAHYKGKYYGLRTYSHGSNP